MSPSPKRVFITGMGVLTPIGLDVESFRRGLIAGQDGIAPVTRFEVQRHRCQLAGELARFAPEKGFRRRKATGQT
jgi:3-oxoacyl-[acyl-carrier-protein] synthase II